jgi:ribonuclease BN (tRNA processing enzyme)
VSTLDFTFVGTGNAFAAGGLCWNGFVVDQKYLFEAPPQALMSLNQLDIDPNGLEAVIISHHHGDHFIGLPFLLLHWKHRGRTGPVRVVGPPRTEEYARDICSRVYPGTFEFNYPIEWVELDAGETTQVADLSLEAVEVQHDERLVLNLGYACRLGDRTFAYTGDSGFCDAVVDLARDTDVLVSECSSLRSTYPTHMNLEFDMPRLREAMRSDAELVLTHLDPRVTAEGLHSTRVAADGETYRL